MFNFFKKPALPSKSLNDEKFFIGEVFRKLRTINDPNEKLEKLVDFYERVRDLELEYDVECYELSFEEDEIRDAFLDATNPKTMFISALKYENLLGNSNELIELHSTELPDHLKARLLRTYIISVLDQELVDPIELEATNQHAFYEVEKLNLSILEKDRVLKEKYGIIGWRSRMEMNPGIIYD